MIIDAHAHLFESLDVYQRSWLDGLKEGMRQKMSPKGYEEWLASLDGRVETLIKDMDEAKIDKSVALPSGCAIAYAEEPPKISIWRSTEYVAEAQSRYPDRIIGFARVDPLRKDSIELLVKAVTEWKLKGVKMVPTIPVTDETVQPIMHKVEELGVPLLAHTGVNPIPYISKNGDPIFLDTLTARFPKMKIIAAHYAKGFEDLLTAIIAHRGGRIYADLGMWQEECAKSPWQFILKMRSLMDRIPRFVLMASDWPFSKVVPMSHKEWFDAIRNLKIPDQVLQLGLGIKDFSQEEKDMILGENARSLLGL